MGLEPESLLPQAPPEPAHQAPGRKWVILVLVGLIAIISVLVVFVYITNENQMGIKVVRMEGTLETGAASDADTIGSEVVGGELRDAADDPMVEAIVLRVNSPGGSPAAAEEIIGDLDYAKSKKPVVVSMGDMATSAAYYVSAHADKIYADPDTFTGGIGVIWTFSDISRWMNTEGYNVTIVKSGDMKDMGSSSHALSDEERDYAQQIVNESFNEFINDVISQRTIARSDIEDGRVFRGADALKINLVDKLGNLNDAIEGAKELATKRH
jgi:protease-4